MWEGHANGLWLPLQGEREWPGGWVGVPLGWWSLVGMEGQAEQCLFLSSRDEVGQNEHFLVVTGGSKDRGVTFEGNVRSPG